MRLRGRHYQTKELIDVVCANSRVTAIETLSTIPADHEAQWIAPGFFDLQINGAGGVSFNAGDLTVEQVGRAVRRIADHGVTGLLPTLVTNDFPSLANALRTLQQARIQDDVIRHRVPGFHVEGPWISPVDGYRGAHPKAHVRNPNWDDFLRLQDAANGLIKLVTLSPELPGALQFIEKLHASNIRIGIGHTAADADTIDAAHQAGATLSTHLGNGLPESIHRHHNPLWPQLSCPNLSASVIMDGHHIPDTICRTILQIKPQENIILISDASSLAGLPPGRYHQWDQEVELTGDNRLILAGTPYLAGSACFLDHCVSKTASLLNNLPRTIAMASITPRHFLDLEQPDLTIGSRAEFILFNHSFPNPINIQFTT